MEGADQAIRYPSLIESSDVDGGSSVAVLTYLRCIIESIDHVDLLRVTLQYLLALPEKSEEEVAPARPTALARRRKSSMLMSNLAQGQEKPAPDLFTLVDLVFTSLRSRNQQTVAATLQLISVIFSHQHQYACLSFVKHKVPSDMSPTRTIDTHFQDTALLFSMAEDLMEHDDLGEAYDAHLQDARTLIELHCCSPEVLALPGTRAEISTLPLQDGERSWTVQPHRLKADDPFLDTLVPIFKDFLTNDISTNLKLTQVFSVLACCGYTRLDGWLLADPVRAQRAVDHDVASDGNSDHDNTITLEKANSHDLERSPIAVLGDHPGITETPDRPDRSISPILASLDSLVHQVDAFRREIQNFDTYLAERRHIFKVGEDIDKAAAGDVLSLPKSEAKRVEESAKGTMSRSQARGQFIPNSQRLSSETSSAEVSRSSSPRGRQLSESSSSTLVRGLNHLRVSPSPSLSEPASRRFSPSPLQKDQFAPSLSESTATPVGLADTLQQKIRVKLWSNHGKHDVREIGGETNSVRSGSTGAESKKIESDFKEITMSHLLTNIIILQEFILELAAIIEVRASLFGEVKFA